MYLTFDEYKSYGGQQSEPAFGRLAYQASAMVDARTFGRLVDVETVPESVKRLIFELVGLLGNQDISAEGYTGVVSSEGNDGYSLTMAAGTIPTTAETSEKAYSLIETYLVNEKTAEGVPLLYCGRLS